MIKQALIFRRDLKLSPGKMVVQGAHAAIGALERSSLPIVREWKRTGVTKVMLAAADLHQLVQLQEKAHAAGLPTYLVCDAGRTEVDPGTITCLAIGPGEIDSIIGSLPLWKEEESGENS